MDRYRGEVPAILTSGLMFGALIEQNFRDSCPGSDSPSARLSVDRWGYTSAEAVYKTSIIISAELSINVGET